MDVDETFQTSPGDGSTDGVPDTRAATKKIRIMENGEENNDPPGEPIRPHEAPCPHDHTVPAGRLLKWPSIRNLIKPLLVKEGIR